MKAYFLFVLAALCSFGASSSENFWFMGHESVLDSGDVHIAKETIPSRISLGDGQFATGMQTLRVFNQIESENGLKVRIGSELSQPIAPGSHLDFQVDLGKHGKLENEVLIYPENADVVSKIYYKLEISGLNTIWNKSGWQEIYNAPNGCDSNSGCDVSLPYPTFSRTRVFMDEPSRLKCSLGGVPNSEGQCYSEETKPAYKTCPSGSSYSSEGCTKRQVRGPVTTLGCPTSHPHDDAMFSIITETTNCYSTRVDALCPKGMGPGDPGVCWPRSKFVGGDPSYKCPTSMPHLLRDRTGRNKYYCASAPSFEEPNFCPSGFKEVVGDNETCVGGTSVLSSQIKSCPVGYNMESDGMCSRMITSEHIYICNNGKLVDGNQCQIKVDKGVPVEYCAAGNNIVPADGRCVYDKTENHGDKSTPAKAPRHATKIWVQ